MELSELSGFVLLASTDSVKIDLELMCLACGAHICDAQHDDSLEVLASTALDHRRSAGCGS